MPGKFFAPRTGMQSRAGNDTARPLTAAKAAGYSSRAIGPKTGSVAFDPFKARLESTELTDSTPELQVREQERAIYLILHESAVSSPESGLSKAKEAAKRERALIKQRESLDLMEQVNLDLTYCVLVNLAHQYYRTGMLSESINTYLMVVKNKSFAQSGRLRANVGHIYFRMKKHAAALKMYRMALDLMPQSYSDFRTKIQKNIASVYASCGKYQDAASGYEAVLESQAIDHSAAYNLLLCYHALGDKPRMKQTFLRMISMEHVQYESSQLFSNESFYNDFLRKYSQEKNAQITKMITVSAQLLAPSIQDTDNGFDWIVEQIKTSPCAFLLSEIEIAKASFYLNKRDYNNAVECLRAFEKRDTSSSSNHALSAAATNLSFLCFYDSELEEAKKHSLKSIEHDRYNAKAHCNLGNCYFKEGDLDRAREMYLESINLDALCTEALYNMGLCYKLRNENREALKIFEKVHSMLRSSPEVLWQVADSFERLGHKSQALECYTMLVSLVPTDPKVLSKLGDLYVREGDQAQAFHYYSESYRFYPSDIDVIAWLGSYNLDCELYEQATLYFERACTIEAKEIKWQLMVASCHRRCGNYQHAFDLYKEIHFKWPNSVECLRLLVRISQDLGVTTTEWQTKLKKLE